MITRIMLCLTLIVLNNITMAEDVEIPDPNLRSVIEEQLGKGKGETITEDDMKSLRGSFVGWEQRGISDLTGLEHATNITTLNLRWNNITDISILGHLNKIGKTYLERE